MQLPEFESTVDKLGEIKDPVTKEAEKFKVIDEIIKQQTNKSDKILILQKIKFDSGRVELRLGYYIIGKRPKMKGKWVWGQYASLMPAEDLKYIFETAQEKGWF